MFQVALPAMDGRLTPSQFLETVQIFGFKCAGFPLSDNISVGEPGIITPVGLPLLFFLRRLGECKLKALQ